MYTSRFRERNMLGASGGLRIEQYARDAGGCDVVLNPIRWVPYYTSSSSTFWRVIDTIADIAGDPPEPSLGLAGYKFHPYTRTKAELVGASGEGLYEIVAKQQSCSGTPGAYLQRYRRVPTGYASAYFWGGLSLPKAGDTLDLSKLDVPWATIDELVGLADTACLAKRGKYGESNLYESLAELDKTFKMLKDIIDRAHRIYHNAFFGRGGISRLRSLSDEAAGQYLLTRYGFAPLIKDIESVLISMETPLGDVLRTSRAEERKDTNKTVVLPDLNIDSNWIVGRTQSTTDTVSVRSMSLDKVELTRMKALGLGFKDLISVPWELKSHSFVLDWFGNIGDVLGALVPDVGVSNVGMCTTVKWVRQDVVVFSDKGVPPSRTDITLASASVPPPITRTIAYTYRTVGSKIPSLHWRTDFKFSSLVRSLDALALLQASAKRVKQAIPGLSEIEKIRRLRLRNPSQRGRRSAADFYNLSD